MKAHDNKTALLKSVLKTVMDPPGGLNDIRNIPCIEDPVVVPKQKDPPPEANKF